MKGGITLAIEDKRVTTKIINIQSCIIQGRSLKALLRMNMNYFLEESGADIITIYMNEHEKIKLEYILEKDKIFISSIEKVCL